MAEHGCAGPGAGVAVAGDLAAGETARVDFAFQPAWRQGNDRAILHGNRGNVAFDPGEPAGVEPGPADFAAIAAADQGVFVYLHHTGRGFGIDTRAPEDAALPEIRFHRREGSEHDLGRQRFVQHESGIGAQILIDLGLRRIRVLTNHPRKVVALEGYGIEIVEQVPLPIQSAKRSHQVL